MFTSIYSHSSFRITRVQLRPVATRRIETDADHVLADRTKGDNKIETADAVIPPGTVCPDMSALAALPTPGCRSRMPG
jgi:hypothetical protein